MHAVVDHTGHYIVNSQDIQIEIYRWATSGGFPTPYRAITGRHLSSAGRDYLSVSFGRGDDQDCEVQIHNCHFIVLRSNQHGCRVFRNYEQCQTFLDTL